METTAQVRMGAPVELVVDLAEGRVAATGHVASRIDVTRAARLGIAPGVAIRFDAAGRTAASQIARELARDADRDEVGPSDQKPTRRLIAPLLTTLLVASKADQDPSSVFQGEIATTAVADLFGFLERTGKSGRLILRNGLQTATIDFVRGSIIDASSTWPAIVRELLFQVIEWRNGEFALHLIRHPPSSVGRGLRVSHLLIKHATHRDELDCALPR